MRRIIPIILALVLVVSSTHIRSGAADGQEVGKRRVVLGVQLPTHRI